MKSNVRQFIERHCRQTKDWVSLEKELNEAIAKDNEGFSREWVALFVEWVDDNYFGRIDDTQKRTMKWRYGHEEIFISTNELIDKYLTSK